MFFLRNIPNTQQQLSNSKLTYSTLNSSRRWWSGSGSTLAEVSTLNSSSFGDRVKSERRKGTGIGLGRPQEGRLDPDLHRRLFEKEEKQQKSNSIQLEVVCILHSSIQYQVQVGTSRCMYQNLSTLVGARSNVESAHIRMSSSSSFWPPHGPF